MPLTTPYRALILLPLQEHTDSALPPNASAHSILPPVTTVLAQGCRATRLPASVRTIPPALVPASAAPFLYTASHFPSTPAFPHCTSGSAVLYRHHTRLPQYLYGYHSSIQRTRAPGLAPVYALTIGARVRTLTQFIMPFTYRLFTVPRAFAIHKSRCDIARTVCVAVYARMRHTAHRTRLLPTTALPAFTTSLVPSTSRRMTRWDYSWHRCGL